MGSADPHLAELERLLKRDEHGRQVGSAFATRKLAPQVMAPPPEPADFAADDLDPVALEPTRPARMVWIAGLVLAIVAAAAVGWMFRPVEPEQAPVAAVPAQPTLPSAPPVPAPTALPEQPAEVRRAVTAPVPAVQEPVPPAESPVAVRPPAPVVQPSPSPPMPDARPAASVGDELVRPDTEGLSPARRVRAQVILVRDDREISAAR